MWYFHEKDGMPWRLLPDERPFGGGNSVMRNEERVHNIFGPNLFPETVPWTVPAPEFRRPWRTSVDVSRAEASARRPCRVPVIDEG